MYNTRKSKSNVRITFERICSIDWLGLQRCHVSFLPKRNPAVGYNLRKPSVTACCFRRKVLFDMYAIQRPATLKWLRAQQSCGSAAFSVALCDTCVMWCTSQAADFIANCNPLNLLHPAATASILPVHNIFNISLLINVYFNCNNKLGNSIRF